MTDIVIRRLRVRAVSPAGVSGASGAPGAAEVSAAVMRAARELPDRLERAVGGSVADGADLTIDRLRIVLDVDGVDPDAIAVLWADAIRAQLAPHLPHRRGAAAVGAGAGADAIGDDATGRGGSGIVDRGGTDEPRVSPLLREAAADALPPDTDGGEAGGEAIPAPGLRTDPRPVPLAGERAPVGDAAGEADAVAAPPARTSDPTAAEAAQAVPRERDPNAAADSGAADRADDRLAPLPSESADRSSLSAVTSREAAADTAVGGIVLLYPVLARLSELATAESTVDVVALRCHLFAAICTGDDPAPLVDDPLIRILAGAAPTPRRSSAAATDLRWSSADAPTHRWLSADASDLRRSSADATDHRWSSADAQRRCIETTPRLRELADEAMTWFAAALGAPDADRARLRADAIRRPARLVRMPALIVVEPEPRAFDPALRSLPYPIGAFALPWTPAITVNWRSGEWG